MDILEVLGTGYSIAEGLYRVFQEHYADVKQKIQDAFVESFLLWQKKYGAESLIWSA